MYIRLYLKFFEKLIFSREFSPPFWYFIMFKECSCGVGTPDYDAMRWLYKNKYHGKVLIKVPFFHLNEVLGVDTT